MLLKHFTVASLMSQGVDIVKYRQTAPWTSGISLNFGISVLFFVHVWDNPSSVNNNPKLPNFSVPGKSLFIFQIWFGYLVTPYINGTSDELQPFSIILKRKKKKVMGLETKDKLFLLETRSEKKIWPNGLGRNKATGKKTWVWELLSVFGDMCLWE